MKIGIIGTGFIVHTFIQAALKHQDITLQAIYSRTQDKADSFSKQYDIPLTYIHLDSIINDPTLDFIYIASPNGLHYEQALMALEANKHVICEKPFTSTVKELEHLVSIAKRNNCYLFEAITTIHLPNYKKIKESLSMIGTPRFIQCNFSQYSSRYDAFLRGENPNVFNPSFSGGALMDLNIYNLHFVIGLFGSPIDMHYYPNLQVNGIDTSGLAILEYDGFIASCVAAKDSASKNILQIQGEKGYILVDSSSMCKKVTIQLLDGTATTYQLQEEENQLYYELGSFVEIYKQQDMLACHALLQHSVQVLRVTENLRKNGKIRFPNDAY